MSKVWVIVRKEWSEVFKNKMVLFAVAFLPLLFTAMPLGILATAATVEGHRLLVRRRCRAAPSVRIERRPLSLARPLTTTDLAPGAGRATAARR